MAAVPPAPLLLQRCRVLDTVQGECPDKTFDVLIADGVIRAIQPRCGEESVPPPAGAAVIDCRGHVLMPGLLDAHVHCTACTANLPGLLSLPESLVTARAAKILEGMLLRGFTTVRDAGGADWGLAQAVEEGAILGPRILFTGHALSQTGGHGDMRDKGEDFCACGAALRGIGRVCDGVPEVRKAARDELRKGAHCIKVMASGGVASPTDRLTNTQFALDELRAIVEEAEAAGTYVCAHAYTARAIRRAVECGVRSIEHGNCLDEATAHLMAQRGTFLVPTLITYQQLAEGGTAAGMAPELVAKVGSLVEQGLSSLRLAQQHGVEMAFGSDLLGDLHGAQLREFELRSRVLPAKHSLRPQQIRRLLLSRCNCLRAPSASGIPVEQVCSALTSRISSLCCLCPAAMQDLIRAATVTAADLFMMGDQLGRVAEGYVADLLLLDGNPLEDVSLLWQPEQRLRLILKGGRVVKDALR